MKVRGAREPAAAKQASGSSRVVAAPSARAAAQQAAWERALVQGHRRGACAAPRGALRASAALLLRSSAANLQQLPWLLWVAATTPERRQRGRGPASPGPPQPRLQHVSDALPPELPLSCFLIPAALLPSHPKPRSFPLPVRPLAASQRVQGRSVLPPQAPLSTLRPPHHSGAAAPLWEPAVHRCRTPPPAAAPPPQRAPPAPPPVRARAGGRPSTGARRHR